MSPWQKLSISPMQVARPDLGIHFPAGAKWGGSMPDLGIHPLPGFGP